MKKIKKIPVIRINIEDLLLKQSSQIVDIVIGNNCNNPCYQYDLKLTKLWSKCCNKVKSDYQNII